MDAFKIYNCDFGIKIGGVRYDFPHVAELQVEDPEKNKLVRGSNQSNKTGIVYKEGGKDPKKWTIPIIAMSSDLKGVLDDCYDNQTRLDVFCIDRTSGSSKMLKNAILCNKPQQLKLDDQPDSMNVSLEFESFDSNEVIKT